ncbi:MAG: hypothetical protein WA948_08910 [Pontixanthobacter sp.]
MLELPELLTLSLAIAFATIHLFVGKLRFLDSEPRSAWLSLAGGVAVGYVFLHVLPELGLHGGVFADATGLSHPLAEGLVYTLSLAGLVLFYGVEKAILISRDGIPKPGDRERPTQAIFWLHIAATSVLVMTITYLLNHREDVTFAGLAIYFVAMSLHFVTADFGSRSHHPEIYDRAGRYVLAAATIAGWVLGQAITLPELAIGCLFAFIAGAIILTVMKEELPEERESRFGPFLAGTVLYAALVLGETYLVY